MISVVIPAYNEEEYIGKTLESLVRQTTKRPYEVIVVDNASTDGTAKVAEAFTDRMDVRVVLEKHKGRGSARHAGFMAARGDIILSSDADTILPPDWIEIMASAFRDPGIVGITGTGYITDCSWFANTVFNFIQPTFTVLYRIFFGAYWVCGFNGGVRRDAYMKTGGYNTFLNSQEDTQLGFDLKKVGRVIRVRQSHVKVSGRRFESGIIGGLWEYVRSFIDWFVLKKKDAYLRDTR